ncbi:shikimate dehydrogenase [Aureimonas pseudogalii]|uniref:Shikimate dehydrogenase (NADP(+)) n=1 Tax=Aureimonas pseudogalii TaxID=1744844 RepID=A0A7W6EF92_9HYPH|nr:shikimate dehydrogenase [Aureimonas pseudogalii]MBB3997560.1 shikimate dehydrogenase [Aureimonas pseudogalii]
MADLAMPVLSRPAGSSLEGPRAFVAGWPIAHSRSPLIHGFWLEEHALPGAYERAGVPPEEFAAFLQGLRAAGWTGGNVTIPHKEAAFAAADRRDGAAEAIGAVNTLWFEGDRLVGGNTDAYGFSANLDERLKGWRDAQNAVVLGAGGAARAVVQALVEAGIGEIAVANRSRDRAERLAADFAGRGARLVALDDAGLASRLAGTDLLVNTRPSEKGGGAAQGAAETSLEGLAPAALVTDIVYVPLETPFLAEARRRGHRTADGLGMLLHQAVPGFERWFGARPNVTPALRARILNDIDAAR